MHTVLTRAVQRSCLAAALFAAAALGGCERSPAPHPTEPAARDLVVHGMLRSGVPEQEILLEFTRPVKDGLYRGLTPASGAVVAVTGPGATHRFAEDVDHPGVYRASFIPEGGASYALHVRGPEGQTLESETTVPGPIRLTVPTRDTVIDRRNAAQVTFRWTRGRSSRGYALESTVPDRPPTAYSLGGFGTGQDTSLVLDVAIESLLSGFATQMRFSAIAMDANYLRYVASSDGGAPGGDRNRVRSTVRGGYGLFGSYSISNPRLLGIQ